MNELDALRLALPKVPDPTDEVLERGRARLTREAAKPRRMPRRLVLAGVLAAAAVLAVLPGLPSHNPPARANAATLLAQAAAIARTDPNVAPEKGKWIYIESKERVTGPMRPDADSHTRTWMPSTGFAGGKYKSCSPALRGNKNTDCVHILASAESIRIVNGKEYRVGILPDARGWDPDNYTFLKALPTDGAGLLARVYQYADHISARSKGKEFRHQVAFEKIADLLDGWTSPQLRGAAYEALARIPGVQVDQSATDLTGRRGIGFSRADHRKRLQIILDRTTYRYLGDQTFAGSTVRWTAQLRAAVVDNPRQLPN